MTLTKKNPLFRSQLFKNGRYVPDSLRAKLTPLPCAANCCYLSIALLPATPKQRLQVSHWSLQTEEIISRDKIVFTNLNPNIPLILLHFTSLCSTGALGHAL